MKALYAEFTARLDAESQVAALMRDLSEAVRAEPGCVTFEPFVRDDNPLHWVIFEVYRDLEAFEAHIGSEHGRVFNKALAGLIEGQGSELTWLREPSL
ncbi:putative quinol monooxygenase [Nocardioides sp.]|uniref:putative quinol monooxygenase n=1 Tax=Nocardioides sp. TaxID=35761 RepID=UPI00286EAAEF|nr:putative quinol monooxygenase [Nocardioides sp.]